MSYVRWPSQRGSWHIYFTYIRGGQTLVRCGRRIMGPPTLVDDLPANARTCESCAVLTIRDQERDEVSNDEVPF